MTTNGTLDPRMTLAAHREAYLRSKLPPERQTLRAGVRRPVRIVRDAGWVPHVYAETAFDLFFGQGFASAQDRLWQLDYLRRRALGRLAEVLGPDGVLSDRRHRLLGFGRLADEEWSVIAAEAAEALEGFAAGVNAWIEAAGGSLPVEFEILEYEPEPWTPRDSLALERALHWQLTGRLENLAAVECAQRILGDALATEFVRPEAPDETILPRGPARASRAGASREVTGGGDTQGGSNNWAAAPRRSESGAALLAADPHLPFALPAGIYLARLSGAGYDVAGANYPGSPGIWFGHSDRVAWGITNLVASTRDVYVETLDPGDPGRYRLDGGWAAFDARVEEVAVRGGAPVRFEVRSTARGPVVDEIVPPLPGSDGTVLSLRWVGQEPLGNLQTLLDLARARDVPSFRRAASTWGLPVSNLVYADVEGHVGWQAVGRVPIRGDGDRTRGFRPANDPGHAWRGQVAFDDLPRLEDPASGWVGSANNRPVDDDFPQPLYGWWAAGHRAARIRSFFEGRERVSLDDFRRMQFDAWSGRAAEAVPALVATLVASGDAAARRLAELLAGWDYQYRPERVAPTVFETFFELWHERVLAARFPEPVRPFLAALGAGSGLSLRLLRDGEPVRRAASDEFAAPLGEGQRSGWFGERSLAAEIVETARAALDELTSRLGPDATRWTWGAVHTISLRHPLHGRPGTDGLFATPPRPAHGTTHALNNNGYAHGARFDVTMGPELRMVVDMGDLDRFGVVLTTGQSGQPGSPHFTDHLERWITGEDFTLPWGPEAVEKAATGETRIEP